MMKTPPLVIAALGVMLSPLSVHGQDRPAYRDFMLGSPTARVVEQLHMTAPDVTVVHARPSLLQDLRWRTPYAPARAAGPEKDSVQQITFSFYDNQLFRMAIEYDRNRTEGLTDADMIASLSERYGSPLTPSRPLNASTQASQATGEWSAPVAQWAEGDVAVVLLRRAFTAGFELVVTSERLDGLARTAAAESIRLDLSEAPARELARQQRDADEMRLAQEKARSANKAAFRP